MGQCTSLHPRLALLTGTPFPLCFYPLATRCSLCSYALTTPCPLCSYAPTLLLCAVRTMLLRSCHALSGLRSYAFAMHCPVLTLAMLLPGTLWRAMDDLWHATVLTPPPLPLEPKSNPSTRLLSTICACLYQESGRLHLTPQRLLHCYRDVPK
eukprot:2825279-Rhodomonas_salina.1